jgi:hypothetical protein
MRTELDSSAALSLILSRTIADDTSPTHETPLPGLEYLYEDESAEKGQDCHPRSLLLFATSPPRERHVQRAYHPLSPPLSHHERVLVYYRSL